MDIEGKIASFVATSEQMLELAKVGEWEQIIQLESERRPQLEAFFISLSPEVRNQKSDQLRCAIEKLIALDQQIVAQGVEYKTEAVKAYQQSQSARHAAAAYQQNTKL